MGKDKRLICLQCVDAQTKIVRLNHVIVGGLLEVLTSREFVHAADVPARAHIALVAIVTNARILSCIAAADFIAAICRAVIGNDKFEIFESLIQERLDSGFKKPLSVIEEKPYADEGPATHEMITPIWDSQPLWAARHGGGNASVS
jgi:hypothetical protein